MTDSPLKALVVWRILLVLGSLLLLHTGLQPAASATSAIGATGRRGAITVVSTAYPLYEVAAYLGGKRIHAVNLLPLDAYALPNERQASELREADVVLALPEGYQPHLDGLLAQRTKPTMRLLHEPRIPSRSPWLDPQYQWEAAERIRATLSAVDPVGAAGYARRGNRYSMQMVRVDRELTQWFSSCKRREVLVSTHDFDLLFARYGIVATVVALDELPEKKQGTHEVYYDTQLPSLDEAQRIEKTYGLRVAALTTVASQPDEARRAKIDYPAAMLINLDALRSGMDCVPRWKLRR